MDNLKRILGCLIHIVMQYNKEDQTAPYSFPHNLPCASLHLAVGSFMRKWTQRLPQVLLTFLANNQNKGGIHRYRRTCVHRYPWTCFHLYLWLSGRNGYILGELTLNPMRADAISWCTVSELSYTVRPLCTICRKLKNWCRRILHKFDCKAS